MKNYLFAVVLVLFSFTFCSNALYFDGDDDCWVDGFISYLEKKYWNKTFHYEYEHKTDSFLIYEVEIPDYKLKQKGLNDIEDELGLPKSDEPTPIREDE